MQSEGHATLPRRKSTQSEGHTTLSRRKSMQSEGHAMLSRRKSTQSEGHATLRQRATSQIQRRERFAKGRRVKSNGGKAACLTAPSHSPASSADPAAAPPNPDAKKTPKKIKYRTYYFVYILSSQKDLHAPRWTRAGRVL